MCIKTSLIHFIMKYSFYVNINYKFSRYHYNIPIVIQQLYCYYLQAERGFAAGAVLFDLGGIGAFWKKKV